jgi:hypothetical protein
MSRDNVAAADSIRVEKSSVRDLAAGEFNVVVEVLRDGKVIARRERHNLVVNTGKADMAKRLVVTPTKLYQYMRLGKNNTAPNSSQTTITTIVTSSNRTCNTAAMSGTRTAKFIRTWLTTDFSSSGINEAGIFSQLTNGSGTMLARVTFTAINKTNHDTLRLTWTIKVN